MSSQCTQIRDMPARGLPRKFLELIAARIEGLRHGAAISGQLRHAQPRSRGEGLFEERVSDLIVIGPENLSGRVLVGAV